MRAPNFFIVGAPKCGTTALAEYLSSHPDIYMCSPKEPHYYATDFPQYRAVTSELNYLSLFDAAGPDRLAVGEASVFYLYSQVAIPELLRQNPGARLIVMLRNPIELAQSMHAQVLRTRDETTKEFEDAWRLCNLRRSKSFIPRHCRDPKVLLYDELPKLGAQLKRLLEYAERTQVRWWFYDDFAISPESVYRGTLKFLGVADDGRTEFPAVNVRKRARSQLVAQFVQKPPHVLVTAALAAKRFTGLHRLGALDLLYRANFRTVQADPLSTPLLNEMRAVFKDDVALLGKLTGRDLSTWLMDT